MTSDSTLYFTAVEDMFKELLTIEVDDLVPGNEEEGSATESETPKRCVQLRKQKLFVQDSTGFVICRRSPRLEPRIGLDLQLTPGRRRELRADEVLQMRKDQAEKERQKPPQRRLTLRI